MSTRINRLLLLSSSALVSLCVAGVALSQTPPTPPQAPQTTTPAAPAPSEPAPTTPQQAPTEPQGTPDTAIPVPEVKVQAPQETPRRQAAPKGAPAPRVAAPPPSPTTAPTPTTQATTNAPSTFNPPYAPLSTQTSQQIQTNTTQDFGNLFFTQPGATSAGLSPGASRPILRGLSDFRVKLQENGTGSSDVSNLGQDHGVPLDPLTIDKTQIYRGPEALRYGSQAIGGIVEAINNRIPMYVPPSGIAAELRAGLSTVDNGWQSGLLLDAGGKNAAIHADVFARRADDYRIPSYPYLFPPTPPPPVDGRQPNSSLHSEGGAVGGSYLFEGGYAGVAITNYATDYHVATLDGATSQTHIQMEQTKIISKGEYRPDATAIAAVRYWAGFTDYKHNEIGLNAIGFDQLNATFKNRAQEGKVEVESMPMRTPLGFLTVTGGAQYEHSQIDTSGDAGSLLGSARTAQSAAYFYNVLQLTDTWRTLLAGRIENNRLDGASGNFPANFLPPPDVITTTPQSLGFVPKSISFSVIKDLPWYLVASATVQRIQRSPTALELFAHGAHDAPGTFEIGNPNLKIETGNSAEIGLKRVWGDFRFDGKAYYTYYNGFIFRQFTGIECGQDFATCGNGGTGFLQTIYGQKDAIFRGAEMAWQWDAMPLGPGIFGLDGQFDVVRATFTDGSNVPQMPPLRVGGGAYWRNDTWFVRMGLLHAFAQTDISQFETSTSGYNILKAEVSHRRYWKDSPWGPVEVRTGIVGDNLLNNDIRNSTQFHKDEILLPGRNFKFFLTLKYGADTQFGPPPGTFKTPKGLKAANGYAANGYRGPLAYYKAPLLGGADWAGLYAGVNVGFSAGRSITSTLLSDAVTGDPIFGDSRSSKLSGGFIGGQAGYNWVSNIWLVGIEGDLQGSGQRGSIAYACPGAVCNPGLAPVDAPVAISLDHKLIWFATLRGRLGTTVLPGWLIYMTGGVAVADMSINGPVSDPIGNAINTVFDNHFIRAGWTIGAGVEGRIFGNWTGKVEYLHMDFGSIATIPPVAPTATLTAVFNSRITDNIFRVGMNYRFDQGGAIVVK
jgi:iron complex outermembrane receptor protein